MNHIYNYTLKTKENKHLTEKERYQIEEYLKDKKKIRKIPKGKKISEYSKKEVKRMEEWINRYPRKILGYQSAGERYEEKLKQHNISYWILPQYFYTVKARPPEVVLRSTNSIFIF